MAVKPYLTIKGAARQLGVAFTTARRAIQRLEKLGVVTEVSGG
jgi:Fic family protein